MDSNAALVGGGTRGLEDSPLAPPRFPVGSLVELVDGRVATVRHQKGYAVGVELEDGRIVDAPRRSLRYVRKGAA